MSQPELLKCLAATLDALSIPYMLTGSVVSSIQGEPRATHGIDVLVVLRPEAVAALVSSFPAEDFYLDEEAVREAIREPDGMFNLIDMTSGDKVDFWLVPQELWSQTSFSRRTGAEFEGQPIVISTPEDTILSKLRWSRLSGGSAKQLYDVRRVIEVQRDRLDLGYLRRWADHLGVRDDLERILADSHAP